MTRVLLIEDDADVCSSIADALAAAPTTDAGSIPAGAVVERVT